VAAAAVAATVGVAAAVVAAAAGAVIAAAAAATAAAGAVTVAVAIATDRAAGFIRSIESVFQSLRSTGSQAFCSIAPGSWLVVAVVRRSEADPNWGSPDESGPPA
jgi:hypothetical protein